ncbi:MAG: AtpZ/AtpI family protein [Spirochaetes bacterium]|nr:AtpZ/AtpI family protein [Spirochaetota bacterium]
MNTWDKKKTTSSIFTYSTIGLELAATVTIFILGGNKLDDHFNRTPVFTIIGAFLGMAIGFYHLIKQLQNIEAREKKDENKIRKKWM